jgi:hypothetical protein
MIAELPLGSISIKTGNLLYQQCADKFIELLKEDPVKFLQQTQPVVTDDSTDDYDNIAMELAEANDRIYELERDIKESEEDEEGVDLGLDYLWFTFEKDNISVREKFNEFVRSCRPTPQTLIR